jgi:hypothetical protein
MAATAETNNDRPWEAEPDSLAIQDEATGYSIQITRGPGGHLCGYVGIPSSHRLFGKNYNEKVFVPASVMERSIVVDKVGVINLFCASLSSDEREAGLLDLVLAVDVHGGLTFSGEAAPSSPIKGLWWLGFDCAHSGDLAPKYGSLGFGDVYRDIAYVEGECRSLAAQLASLSEAR